jgi:hypothetical protein
MLGVIDEGWQIDAIDVNKGSYYVESENITGNVGWSVQQKHCVLHHCLRFSDDVQWVVFLRNQHSFWNTVKFDFEKKNICIEDNW